MQGKHEINLCLSLALLPMIIFGMSETKRKHTLLYSRHTPGYVIRYQGSLLGGRESTYGNIYGNIQIHYVKYDA